MEGTSNTILGAAGVVRRHKQQIALKPGMMLPTRPPYALLKRIGAGGMSEVWLANQIFDLKTRTGQRKVAIKFLLDQRSELLEEKLLREAELSIGLQNEYIVTAYDFGFTRPLKDQDLEVPYLALEYIDGYDIDHFLEKLYKMYRGEDTNELIDTLLRLEQTDARRPPDQVVGFTLFCIAHALDYAQKHADGLIHRDISPGNILLKKKTGSIKLSDLGIAATGAEVENAGEGIIGKFPYISREGLLAPSSVDGRSDIYSLGITAYEMITGFSPNMPFDEKKSSNYTAYIAHLSDLFFKDKEILPPHKVIAGVDRDLSRIIEKMVRNLPQDRYQTAGEVVKDVKETFLYKKRMFKKGAGITKEGLNKLIELLEKPEMQRDNPREFRRICSRDLYFLEGCSPVRPRRLTEEAEIYVQRRINPCRYTEF